MTRLQEHRKKVFTRQIFLTVVILITFFILIFYVGLKILFNTSLFIANKTFQNSDKKTLQDITVNPVLGSVEIDSIPLATNSAEMIVEGTIENYDTVAFYMNGEKVDEKKISSSSFSNIIKNLKIGKNEFYIVAKSSGNPENKKTSKIYTVIYNNEKPKLEIKEPSDNTKTSKNEIIVRGETQDDATIQVNEMPVVKNANNLFETNVQLHDGENKIIVEAQDSAGNKETKEIKVIFEKE